MMNVTCQGRSRAGGFTLIEIMVVVAIVAILFAIALPSYQNSIIKGNRSDAQAALIGFAQAMEKHYARNYTYEGAADGGSDTGYPATTVYSNRSPIDPNGGSPLYDLAIQGATASTFTLRATPITGQRQEGDGFMEINQLGQKSWDKNNDDVISSDEMTWK